MKMTAYSSEQALLVQLDGEIDHHSAAEVRESMDKMIGELRPKTLVLELGRIDFMDSSGLGLVLGRYRRLRELGATMLIQNPPDRVEKLLRMAGVDKLIGVRHTDAGTTDATDHSNAKGKTE